MNRIVFLVDVDNTLLDNDYIQAELKSHLGQFSRTCLRNLAIEIISVRFSDTASSTRKTWTCCRCHRSWSTILSLKACTRMRWKCS
jgi:hypothetical protein